MRFNTKTYVSKCIASNSLTKVNVNKCIMGDTRRYNSNGVRELVYFVVYEMIRFQCYFTIRIVSCNAIFMQLIKMFGILYYFFYIIFFAALQNLAGYFLFISNSSAYTNGHLCYHHKGLKPSSAEQNVNM